MGMTSCIQEENSPTSELFFSLSVLERIPGKINRENPLTLSLDVNQMT